VVVAARNAERELPVLLRALEGQTLERERFEVIVADDGSTDGTAAAIQQHPIATLVRSPRAQGLASARSLGLARARGDVIAFTDADCEPDAGWLECGLADLAECGADLLGGRVEIPLGDRPSTAALIDFSRHLDQEKAVNEAGYAVTANLFARQRVLEDVGSFTPGMRAGEDVEWVLRATSSGWRLAYSARAMVRHPPRATASAVIRKSYRNGYGNGQWRLRAQGPLRLHGPAWRAPSSYRPVRHLVVNTRLAGTGLRLSAARRLALDVAHYFLIQVPFVAGSLVATLRRGRPAGPG
jgi:glycosyltransferase involved in cell wall biosynthesis